MILRVEGIFGASVVATGALAAVAAIAAAAFFARR